METNVEDKMPMGRSGSFSREKTEKIKFARKQKLVDLAVQCAAMVQNGIDDEQERLFVMNMLLNIQER